MPNFEKFEPGHFAPTPEEIKRNPDIVKKMEAANKALKEKAGEGKKARDSLREALEQIPEEEKPEEKPEEVAA